MRRIGSLRTWLDVLSTAAMLAVAASVLSTLHLKSKPDSGTRDSQLENARNDQGVPTEPVSIDGAPRLGRADAPIVVVQYVDFQCPYCGTVAREGVPVIIDSHIKPGKVQLIFRHLPLDRIHPMARQAAEVAECAGQQGKFWEMHDVLFKAATPLQSAHFRSLAKTIGLHVPRFQECVSKRETAQRVNVDAAEAAGYR